MLINQMELFLKKFNTLKECIEKDDLDTMKEIMKVSTKRREYFDN